mgnify:CR=1 FL=1
MRPEHGSGCGAVNEGAGPTEGVLATFYIKVRRVIKLCVPGIARNGSNLRRGAIYAIIVSEIEAIIYRNRFVRAAGNRGNGVEKTIR